MTDDRPGDAVPRAEYQLWHLYDAGSDGLALRVRYRDGVEVPDWRDGPDPLAALERAESEGWRLFDQEPGIAPGECAIFHLVREVRPDRPPR